MVGANSLMVQIVPRLGCRLSDMVHTQGIIQYNDGVADFYWQATMVDFDKIELDEEERELEASFERGEWVSVENRDAEIERYQSYARSFSSKPAGDSDGERSPRPAPASAAHRR